MPEVPFLGPGMGKYLAIGILYGFSILFLSCKGVEVKENSTFRDIICGILLLLVTENGTVFPYIVVHKGYDKVQILPVSCGEIHLHKGSGHASVNIVPAWLLALLYGLYVPQGHFRGACHKSINISVNDFVHFFLFSNSISLEKVQTDIILTESDRKPPSIPWLDQVSCLKGKIQ